MSFIVRFVNCGKAHLKYTLIYVHCFSWNLH